VISGMVDQVYQAMRSQSPHKRGVAGQGLEAPGTASWAITPNVHLLITGGGITADGQHWEPARGEFLVPASVLSRKIAAQFCAALKTVAPDVFADIPARVWKREWVSFCKHYGYGNDAVLTYLSRYVFRTVSQGPILRTMAPLEARPVQSRLGPLDPGNAARHRAATQDGRPHGGSPVVASSRV
jgi:hypothetical protein